MCPTASTKQHALLSTVYCVITAWAALHSELQESCPEGAGRAVSQEDLVWAMECVLSRAFSGQFGFSSAALVAAAAAVAVGGAYSWTSQEPWVSDSPLLLIVVLIYCAV
jgi:hypothetical protein